MFLAIAGAPGIVTAVVHIHIIFSPLLFSLFLCSPPLGLFFSFFVESFLDFFSFSPDLNLWSKLIPQSIAHISLKCSLSRAYHLSNQFATITTIPTHTAHYVSASLHNQHSSNPLCSPSLVSLAGILFDLGRHTLFMCLFLYDKSLVHCCFASPATVPPCDQKYLSGNKRPFLRSTSNLTLTTRQINFPLQPTV